MKAEERKALVTNEDDIRVGDLLELNGCLICNGRHRFIVLKLQRLPHMMVHGPGGAIERMADVQAVTRTPRPQCSRFERFVPRVSIAARRLYRVDAGLLDEENPYVAKKNTLQNAR